MLSQTVSFVKSSSVGPSPPVYTITSHLSRAVRVASSISLLKSLITVVYLVFIPRDNSDLDKI